MLIYTPFNCYTFISTRNIKIIYINYNLTTIQILGEAYNIGNKSRII